MRQFFWLILGLLCAGLSTSSEPQSSVVVRQLESIPFSFAKFLGQFRSSNHTIGDYLPDKVCVFDLEQFGNALQSDALWALNVYDSWGKIPAGLLQGNYFMPGNFEQCRKQTRPNAARWFNSQHCTVRFGFHTLAFPLSPVWLGICLPDSCEPGFIKLMADYFALENGLDPINDYLQADFCYRNEPSQNLGGVAISAIVILSIIAAGVVASTAAEVFGLLFKRPVPQYLKDISLYNNLATLFKTEPKAEQKTDTLDCVNGIRSILMLQIIAHHVHDALRNLPVSNNLSREEYFETAPGILSYRVSALSADIFLVLSAMLLTYGVMRELTNNAGKIGIVRIWIHRIVRVLPAYGFLIYFVVAFAEHFGEGPLYRHVVQPTVDACADNWWSAILFIQNYVNPDRLCLPHTWYLSVDMQLYIVSPIFIYLLWRYGKQITPGLAMLVLIPVVCVFATFTYNDFWLNPPMADDREMHRLRSTYYATHARMSVWFFGIGFGYFLFQTREKQVKWSVTVLTVVSIFATALSGFIMYTAHEIYKPRALDPLGDAFYESLHRVAWVGCHMWLIFMCVNGYGSVLDSFLSWAVWQPVARLSYCMYLIHYVVIMVTFEAVTRQPFHFSAINVQYIMLGVVGLSAAASLVWTLFIERPCVALEKKVCLLIRRSRQ
ncbi:nose resistant to fluoxetine protein 6-like [Topomyia yanbarensis]|uniref:nose resistant to fluoxetine protein 6-like n=1 Tax=Topomyia yanbarensis TaxID=2498891 RepID=UPI00273AB8C7|nr:nose resistant to fluoxetine protein 6-like [Topomyia yanbarensis]